MRRNDPRTELNVDFDWLAMQRAVFRANAGIKWRDGMNFMTVRAERFAERPHHVREAAGLGVREALAAG